MTKEAQITKAFFNQQILKINVNFFIFLFQLKRNTKCFKMQLFIIFIYLT